MSLTANSFTQFLERTQGKDSLHEPMFFSARYFTVIRAKIPKEDKWMEQYLLASIKEKLITYLIKRIQKIVTQKNQIAK